MVLTLFHFLLHAFAVLGAPFSELTKAAEHEFQNTDLKFNPSPADALWEAIRSIRVSVSAFDHDTCGLGDAEAFKAFDLPLVGDREVLGDITMKGEERWS